MGGGDTYSREVLIQEIWYIVQCNCLHFPEIPRHMAKFIKTEQYSLEEHIHSMMLTYHIIPLNALLAGKYLCNAMTTLDSNLAGSIYQVEMM